MRIFLSILFISIQIVANDFNPALNYLKKLQHYSNIYNLELSKLIKESIKIDKNSISETNLTLNSPKNLTKPSNLISLKKFFSQFGEVLRIDEVNTNYKDNLIIQKLFITQKFKNKTALIQMLKKLNNYNLSIKIELPILFKDNIFKYYVLIYYIEY